MAPALDAPFPCTRHAPPSREAAPGTSNAAPTPQRRRLAARAPDARGCTPAMTRRRGRDGADGGDHCATRGGGAPGEGVRAPRGTVLLAATWQRARAGRAAVCALAYALCVANVLPLAGGFSLAGCPRIGRGTAAAAGGAVGLRRRGDVATSSLRFPAALPAMGSQQLGAGAAGLAGGDAMGAAWRRLAVSAAARRTFTVLAAEAARGGPGEGGAPKTAAFSSSSTPGGRIGSGRAGARIGSVRVPAARDSGGGATNASAQDVSAADGGGRIGSASYKDNTGPMSDQQV